MKPRLAGQSNPFYSLGASDSFVEVLLAAMDIERPNRVGASHSYTESGTRLSAAVDKASLWCNKELLDRMHAFRDAVLDESCGESDGSRSREAREHFTSGCRQALGTDR